MHTLEKADNDPNSTKAKIDKVRDDNSVHCGEVVRYVVIEIGWVDVFFQRRERCPS